jgi:hypothetical protein
MTSGNRTTYPRLANAAHTGGHDENSDGAAIAG